MNNQQPFLTTGNRDWLKNLDGIQKILIYKSSTVSNSTGKDWQCWWLWDDDPLVLGSVRCSCVGSFARSKNAQSPKPLYPTQNSDALAAALPTFFSNTRSVHHNQTQPRFSIPNPQNLSPNIQLPCTHGPSHEAQSGRTPVTKSQTSSNYPPTTNHKTPILRPNLHTGS